MGKARMAMLAALVAGAGLLTAPQVQADQSSDCQFWFTEFGSRPAPTGPANAKTAKITFTPPSTMAKGRRYGFTFGTSPADADGHLSVKFGGGDSFRRAYGDALRAKVVDGKVLNEAGQPVDIPMLRVHPDLIDPDTWQQQVYVWASFRDLATGKYTCKKVPVTITN